MHHSCIARPAHNTCKCMHIGWLVINVLVYSYQSILSDITVVWMAYSLPVLEPLTPKRLEKIVTCTLSCLYAAVTVATADTIINMVKPATAAQPASKDEEIEGYGRAIVQKSVRLFSNSSFLFNHCLSLSFTFMCCAIFLARKCCKSILNWKMCSIRIILIQQVLRSDCLQCFYWSWSMHIAA